MSSAVAWVVIVLVGLLAAGLLLGKLRYDVNTRLIRRWSRDQNLTQARAWKRARRR